MVLPGGYFWGTNLPFSHVNRWHHVVLNYIGPDHGSEGIQIYLDGEHEKDDKTMTAKTSQSGNGRVVVGRYHTDLDEKYASVDVDELLFFNHRLTDAQITSIKNNV